MDYETSKGLAQFAKIIFILFIIYLIFRPKRTRTVGDNNLRSTFSPNAADDHVSHNVGRPRLLWEGCHECAFEYRTQSDKSLRFEITLLAIIEKSGRVYIHGLNKIDRLTKNFILDDVVGDFLFTDVCVAKIGLLNYLKSLDVKPIDTSKKSVGKRSSSNATDHRVKTKKRLNDTKLVEELSFSARNRKEVVDVKRDIDWRKEGLLSLSGYRVGKSRGVAENIRHLILKALYQEDDLLDVSDRVYAAEWGDENTIRRYKKINDSISTFLYQAEKRNKSPNVNLDLAISQWKADLEFMDSIK